jgi:hypothetical protein
MKFNLSEATEYVQAIIFYPKASIYPTRQIFFQDQTKKYDGDPSRQREGWPPGKKEVPWPAHIVGASRALKEADSNERNSNVP